MLIISGILLVISGWLIWEAGAASVIEELENSDGWN